MDWKDDWQGLLQNTLFEPARLMLAWSSANQSYLLDRINYHNDPNFPDRQVWANSVESDQTHTG